MTNEILLQRAKSSFKVEDLNQLLRLHGCYGNQHCHYIIHTTTYLVYSAHIFLNIWSRKTNEVLA